MNPSIHLDEHGIWRCMVRCVNYRLGKPLPRMTITRTVMLELDPDTWSIRRAMSMADAAARTPPAFTIRGYEDARLFVWQGKLRASATCCDLTPRGARELVLLDIGPAEDDYAIQRVTPLRGSWSGHYQKNWIPVVTKDRNELSFVYAIDHGMKLDIVDAPVPCVADICHKHGEPRRQRIVRWGDLGGLRGSSQAMRWGDGWLIVVHDRLYRSQIVLTDEVFRITHWTPAFYFREIGIEFCAGATLDLEHGQLVASYSVKDATVELATMPIESVLSKLVPVNS
jgi:hypothetical protein